MNDKQKIRKAWKNCPRFSADRTWRVPEPIEPFVEWRDNGVAPERNLYAVEFRHEFGTKDGRPARRIMGRLRDTEVEVAFAFTD